MAEPKLLQVDILRSVKEKERINLPGKKLTN